MFQQLDMVLDDHDHVFVYEEQLMNHHELNLNLFEEIMFHLNII